MSPKNLILLVEESDSSLGFYNSVTAELDSRISLSLWPHEVTVSQDGSTAYVSNFGLRDYDLTLGYAGNSISVIDIAARCETHRLYTATQEFQYWAPHGVRLSPDGLHLYVNVERTVGSRSIDPTVGPGQEQTKILVFDVKTRRLEKTFNLPAVHEEERTGSLKALQQNVLFGEAFAEKAVQSYGVPRGSHNFLFAHDGSLWIFSGPNGISRIHPDSGEVTWQSKDFKGSVRGLALLPDGNLLVSATNELSIVDTTRLVIRQKIGNLGVSQILYSQSTADGKHALAPAVWEGQLLVVDLEAARVVKRLVTGVDPVHVIVPRGSNKAYVTHGRSKWAAEIDTDTFEISRRIATSGGPNGVDVAKWFPSPKRGTITLAALLPFTGRYSVQGRELRLGYELWRDRINGAGGMLIEGRPCSVEIEFADTASETGTDALRQATLELLHRSRAKFLLGGFPRSANWGLARAAEEAAALFITSTCDDARLFAQGFQNTFGLLPPSSSAAALLFQTIWRRISPKPSSVALIVANDADALLKAHEMASQARGRGMAILKSSSLQNMEEFIAYPPETGIAYRLVEQVAQLTPDLLIHIGERQAAIQMMKLVKQQRITPGCIVSTSGVTTSALRTELGVLADKLCGTVPWSATLENYGHDRFVSASDYVRFYQAQHSETPSYLAAGASACGIALETAIRQVNTALVDRVRDALLRLDRPTFFGYLKFKLNGMNSNGPILVVQLDGNSAGAERILAPDDRAVSSGRLRWPFDQ